MMKRKLILNIINILLVLLIVFIIVNIAISKINNRPPEFFGYSAFVVQTASMSGEIEVGDLIISKKVDIEEIRLNDNIVFISADYYGKTIVHKVIEINESDDGISFVTKGIANSVEDESPVTADNFYGKCVGVSIILGNLYYMITSTSGLLFLAVTVTSIYFAIKQIKKMIKLSKEKENNDN